MEYDPETNKLHSIYNSGRDNEKFAKKRAKALQRRSQLQKFDFDPEPVTGGILRQLRRVYNEEDPLTGAEYDGEVN